MEARYSGSHAITACPLEPEKGIALNFVALWATNSYPFLAPQHSAAHALCALAAGIVT